MYLRFSLVFGLGALPALVTPFAPLGPRTALSLPSRCTRALAIECNVPSESFDEVFEQGSSAVADGDLEIALGFFLRARDMNPSHQPTQTLIKKLEASGVLPFDEEVLLEATVAVLEDGDDAAVDEQQRRVDLALAALGRTGDGEAAAAAGGFAQASPDLSPSPELPADAVVALAGADTLIGGRVLSAIERSGLQGLAVERQTDIKSVLAEADALVVVSAAAGGAGGVEPSELPALMAAVPDSLTRLVYLSVHGVERVDRMPYAMANVFGQLDKLRAAEQEVQLRALKRLPAVSVVRVGALQDDASDASALCELAPGDALQGGAPASAVASVLVEALTRAEAVNASFSLGPFTPPPPSGEPASASADVHWQDEFLRLCGPEIYRRPLSGVSVERAKEWLRLWARDFLKDGQRLTTPVEIENVADGVMLRFLQPGGVGYDLDFDRVETSEERFVASKAASREGRAKSRGSPDGALLVVAEGQPYARVRVARAEMAEGVVPKEMSEQEVLERLERGLRGLER